MKSVQSDETSETAYSTVDAYDHSLGVDLSRRPAANAAGQTRLVTRHNRHTGYKHQLLYSSKDGVKSSFPSEDHGFHL